MTQRLPQSARLALPTTRPIPSISIIREVLIWNRAWQECRRLHRLTETELQDIGLTRADCDAITVAQIAARMRG